MKERPILFSAPMIRALLTCTKTQTRRIAKEFEGKDDLDAILKRFPNQNGCPYGQPGDRLYVREAWRTASELDKFSGSKIADMCMEASYRRPWAPIQYEADSERRNWMHTGTPPHSGAVPEPGRYRHARFMPRWASRITLEIVRVRVERLQDINESDAEAEGALEWGKGALSPDGQQADPTDQFRWLWDSINGPDAWSANPWVWIVEFKRINA